MCKILLAVLSLVLTAPLDGGAAMLVAARASFAISRAKRWVNPYVADGLVAMWDGTLYCLRLYSRKLTAEEVAANHAADRTRFPLT